jgi:hypothetical protein
MEKKLLPIRARLETAFPASQIEYADSGGLHKLRIEHAGPPHWLILDIATVSDLTEEELLKLFEKHRVADILVNATLSRRLALTHDGVIEQAIPK